MTDKFISVFKAKKPIIGMLHLLGNTQQEIVENAIDEMKMMTKHGVAAVLVENYFGCTQDVENVLAVLQRDYPDVVYGVNVLGDIEIAYKLARWYNAKFIQVDSICGHHVPERERSYFEKIDALREDCDALLLGGVRFKYHPVCSGRSVEEDLEIGKQHCDAIVVTGSGTGIHTDLEKIKTFRSVLGDFPLVVGAGMTADTVAEQLTYADGGIVGSYFKYNGDAYGYMDEDRVKQFMANTNQLVFYDQIIIQSLPQIISWIQKDNTTVLFRVLEMSEDERETWLKNVLSSLSSEQKQEIIKWLFELNNLNLCDLLNT